MNQKKNAKKSAPAASARDLLTLTVRTGVQAGSTEARRKLDRESDKKLG
ncbi:MAG: hypothetical protein U0324_30025 [Polyangiales bacterium]